MPNPMEIRGALTALALIVVALLVGVHIRVGIPGQPILETLRFHLAVLLVIIVVCLLLAGANWRAAFFALLAIASAGQGLWVIGQQQAGRPASAALAGLPSLSVLHFNMLFNNHGNGRAIADLVRDSGAAFAFLAEAAPIRRYLPELRQAYPDQIGCMPENACDLLFLSRYKLSEVKIHTLGEMFQNRAFSAYADVDGTRVAIVAVHLTKPYFDDFAAGEIKALADIIDSLDGPVIVSGDFNAAPWSKNLQRLLLRCKLVPAPSYPATWPPEIGMFGVPLDNIFTRAPAFVTEIAPLSNTLGSNHRGLAAKVSIPPVQPAL
jgi:endonuclease/exonuclease/phosphatase (EEP) superfamily protein YafD